MKKGTSHDMKLHAINLEKEESPSNGSHDEIIYIERGGLANIKIFVPKLWYCN